MCFWRILYIFIRLIVYPNRLFFEAIAGICFPWMAVLNVQVFTKPSWNFPHKRPTQDTMGCDHLPRYDICIKSENKNLVFINLPDNSLKL